MIATSKDPDMHSDANLDIRDILLDRITVRNAADMVSLLCDLVLEAPDGDSETYLFNAFEVKIATIQHSIDALNTVIVVWCDLTFRDDQPMTRK